MIKNNSVSIVCLVAENVPESFHFSEVFCDYCEGCEAERQLIDCGENGELCYLCHQNLIAEIYQSVEGSL